MNGTRQEGRAAGAGHGGVEVSLTTEDLALGQAGSVRGAGFPADERGEDGTGAGCAECVFGRGSLEEEESDVVGLEGVDVGFEDGLRSVTADVGVERTDGNLGGDLTNAVSAGIVLGANSVLEGDHGVERIVERKDVRVLVRRQFSRACGVEIGELGANGGF